MQLCLCLTNILQLSLHGCCDGRVVLISWRTCLSVAVCICLALQVYNLHIQSAAATVALYNTIDSQKNVYYSTHPVRQVRSSPIGSTDSTTCIARDAAHPCRWTGVCALQG